MEKYPNATRNHIVLHATGSATRVRELAKQGLIKLPKALTQRSKIQIGMGILIRPQKQIHQGKA